MTAYTTQKFFFYSRIKRLQNKSLPFSVLSNNGLLMVSYLLYIFFFSLFALMKECSCTTQNCLLMIWTTITWAKLKKIAIYRNIVLLTCILLGLVYLFHVIFFLINNHMFFKVTYNFPFYKNWDYYVFQPPFFA